MKGIVKKANDNSGPGLPVTLAFSGLNGGLSRTVASIVYTMENNGGSEDSFSLSGSTVTPATYYVTEQNNFNGTFLQGTNTLANTYTAPASNYVEWDNLSLSRRAIP